MKKTKHFNISVPELGDTPDITQVSNAISDLEDATAGTLEIMKASIQGSGLTLMSVARQTKRTGYYEGMSMRFLCPQTISANTLKTVVVDDLSQQVITVPFDIVSGEYVDITYRGTSFTAHPVVIQKSESIDSNSNETVATSKAVKKVNDKANELKHKSPTREQRDSASFTLKQLMNEKFYGTIRFNGEREGFPCSSDFGSLFVANGDADTSVFFYSPNFNDNTLYYRSGNSTTIENKPNDWCKFWTTDNFNPDTKEPVFEKKSGFNKEKTSEYKSGGDAEKLFTQEGANSLYKLVENKVSKSGDTITGQLVINGSNANQLEIQVNGKNVGRVYAGTDNGTGLYNLITGNIMKLHGDGSATIQANNLHTSSKEVIAAINEINSNKVSKSGDNISGSLRSTNVQSPFIANYTTPHLSGIFARGYQVRIDDVTKSEFGVYGNDKKAEYTYLGSSYEDPALRLYHDGNLYLRAQNLTTNNKEVVKAINEVNNKADTKLSKNDFAGNPILWSGASYNVTVTLPGDVQSLNDVLYIQVFGANDNACIDGNFLQSIHNGTRILLGYVQGTIDQNLSITKIDNRSFRFDIEGSGYETGGTDQTNKIKYIVLRRI